MEPHRMIDDVNPAALRPAPLVVPVPGERVLHLAPTGRPPRPFPWRRLRRAAAVAVAVTAIGAAGFVWWDRTVTHSGGPVEFDAGISGQRLAVGQATAFHDVTLLNRAGRPATLENVRILGVTGGFDVLGVRANRWPDAAGISAGAPGVPPTGAQPSTLAGEHVVPVATTNTHGEPGNGLELAISARTMVPGVARIRGLEITYRVGPRRYRRFSEAPRYLCAPLEQFTVDTCPGKAEGQFGTAAVDFPVRP